MRQDTAYFTPSAVIIGLGLHDLFSSLYLLASKTRSSSTPIWRIAVISWIALFAFVTSQLAILDYVTVPYPTPPYFGGLMQILNYSLDFMVGFGVGVMLLIRIQIVYGFRSWFFLLMFIMFLGMMSFKGLGNAYGCIVGLNVINNPDLDYRTDPVYPNSPRYLGIGQIIEAAFFSTGSIGFLYSLGKALGKTTENIFSTILFKYEGLSLITIVFLNLVIASFGIYISVFGFTFVNHVGLCICLLIIDLPSWTYSLEFYTFLKHSYIDARAMIEESFHVGATGAKIESPIPNNKSNQSFSTRYATSEISLYQK